MALIHGEAQALQDEGYLPLAGVVNPAAEPSAQEGEREATSQSPTGRVPGSSGAAMAAASESQPSRGMLLQKGLQPTINQPPPTINQIAAAGQNRCTKELASYVSAVCMHLGF